MVVPCVRTEVSLQAEGGPPPPSASLLHHGEEPHPSPAARPPEDFLEVARPEHVSGVEAMLRVLPSPTS